MGNGLFLWDLSFYTWTLYLYIINAGTGPASLIITGFIMPHFSHFWELLMSSQLFLCVSMNSNKHNNRVTLHMSFYFMSIPHNPLVSTLFNGNKFDSLKIDFTSIDQMSGKTSQRLDRHCFLPFVFTRHLQNGTELH